MYKEKDCWYNLQRAVSDGVFCETLCRNTLRPLRADFNLTRLEKSIASSATRLAMRRRRALRKSATLPTFFEVLLRCDRWRIDVNILIDANRTDVNHAEQNSSVDLIVKLSYCFLIGILASACRVAQWTVDRGEVKCVTNMRSP